MMVKGSVAGAVIFRPKKLTLRFVSFGSLTVTQRFGLSGTPVAPSAGGMSVGGAGGGFVPRSSTASERSLLSRLTLCAWTAITLGAGPAGVTARGAARDGRTLESEDPTCAVSGRTKKP